MSNSGNTASPTGASIAAVTASQQAVLTPTVVQSEGAGKAYQSAAQSMAIAVQDSTDYLRNVTTIAVTGQGVALSMLIATGDPKYALVIEETNKMISQASTNFKTIGVNASDVLRGFPSS